LRRPWVLGADDDLAATPGEVGGAQGRVLVRAEQAAAAPAGGGAGMANEPAPAGVGLAGAGRAGAEHAGQRRVGAAVRVGAAIAALRHARRRRAAVVGGAVAGAAGGGRSAAGVVAAAGGAAVLGHLAHHADLGARQALGAGAALVGAVAGV